MHIHRSGYAPVSLFVVCIQICMFPFKYIHSFHYITLHYITNTIHYITLQHNTLQYNTIHYITYVHTHLCICLYLYVYVCVYIYIYISIYLYISICIYIHIYLLVNQYLVIGLVAAKDFFGGNAQAHPDMWQGPGNTLISNKCKDVEFEAAKLGL